MVSTLRKSVALTMTTAVSLFGGILLAASVFISSLTGCIMGSEKCLADSVAPVNVAASTGDGAVTISWEIPAYDSTTLNSVWAQVQYDTAGGSGAQCNTYHPNDLAPGCAVACQLSSATQCHVTGLTNGKAYTFTVITQASSKNLQCGNGTSFARTESVTPFPAMLP